MLKKVKKITKTSMKMMVAEEQRGIVFDKSQTTAQLSRSCRRATRMYMSTLLARFSARKGKNAERR
jgi:hypothetical protein